MAPRKRTPPQGVEKSPQIDAKLEAAAAPQAEAAAPQAEAAAPQAEAAAAPQADDGRAPLPEELPAAAPAPKAALEPGFITVRAKQGFMFEPFQRIPLPQGQEVPVRQTDWVICQLRAGLLIRS